ncbi:uncharacterized protein N7515_002687 [Penicillium bovifimosum]|uniref:Uncharacterized protein n=1 Tax=Penicillium bovifimosum TaxID=126998 RepID=A0A9W9HC00_9EURO|nr:uncharacterized protein N7515_002687 [Penicillium bovifimosum]KAJ5143900.1 hypothetical protein N7515_002687 [Penicillium bovifimosum]
MARSSSHSRSTRPMRSSRTKVQTYQEESSSQDETTDLRDSRRTSLSLRSRNTARVPKSYREESTDTSVEESVEALESESSVTPSNEAPYLDLGSASTPRPSRAQPSRRATTTPKSKTTKRALKSSGQVGRILPKRAKTLASEPISLGSGVIPPWQTLPYHVLLDIFLHASHPVFDEVRSARNDSVNRAVSLPPLLPASKSHSLLRLLEQPQESLSMNYSSKIKELHVEVEPLLLYKSGPTLGYFDLAKLIEKTPQVHTVRLYHRDDFELGFSQWQINQSKWTYRSSVFSALAKSGISLRSWDWNARFLNTDELVDLMMRTHPRRAFQSLRELRLFRFDNPSQMDSATKEAGLSQVLCMLPDLQRLTFTDSFLVGGQTLINLPHTIRSLTLNNCDNLWSPDLTSYLSSHGTNLRELSLSHNRHLNMSFIHNLAQSCENLEVFKMDLSMHDASSYHDIEPHFEDLLARTEVPTWPTKLQEIELIQLRNWDEPTAEIFFDSLVNAAPGLRDLRRLAISALLEIAWRDRANFRERWIPQLERVFLRRSTQPNPNLRSLHKRPLKSNSSVTGERLDEPEAQIDDSMQATSSRESHAISQRQSTRLARQKSREADDVGMCDVVNIRIDNQRPSELQYDEDDFLDDELSGDEDWAG